jgi:hypothetical protein
MCYADLIMGCSTGLFYHRLYNVQGMVEVFLIAVVFGVEVYHNFRQIFFVSSYLKF